MLIVHKIKLKHLGFILYFPSTLYFHKRPQFIIYNREISNIFYFCMICPYRLTFWLLFETFYVCMLEAQVRGCMLVYVFICKHTLQENAIYTILMSQAEMKEEIHLLQTSRDGEKLGFVFLSWQKHSFSLTFPWFLHCLQATVQYVQIPTLDGRTPIFIIVM